MTYQVLTDKGYNKPNLIILALVNLFCTLYLFFFTISKSDLIIISIVLTLMFIIETFSKFRVSKSLPKAILLLFMSLNGMICWQLYKSSFTFSRQVFINVGAVLAWFISSLFLGRYWYGYLDLASRSNKVD